MQVPEDAHRVGPHALGQADAPAALIVAALRESAYVLIDVAWDEGFAPEDIGQMVWFCGGEVVRGQQGPTYQALARRRSH